MKTVGVFFGGRSNEHEISVITGLYAANLLRGAGYRVFPVYLPREGGMTCLEHLKAVKELSAALPPVRFVKGGIRFEKRPRRTVLLDCALNCCHGGGGEGGVLSALFEWYSLPSASPKVPESAVFLDKTLTKYALLGLGVPVVPFFVCKEGEAFPKERAERLGYPLVVKPSKLGSSIGVSVARDEGELERALAFCFRLDRVALVEKYLSGKRDLNCAAYRAGEQICLSPVEEVFSSAPILTFGEKYERAQETKLPADVPEAIKEEIGRLLRCVYEQFDMRGVVRADFLLSGNLLYFNELNTVPGSLASYLFGESLTCARQFLSLLVENASLEEQKEIVSSGILSTPLYGGKAAKRRKSS